MHGKGGNDGKGGSTKWGIRLFRFFRCFRAFRCMCTEQRFAIRAPIVPPPLNARKERKRRKGRINQDGDPPFQLFPPFPCILLHENGGGDRGGMRDAPKMQSDGKELTGQVIGCFFTTYNDLGFGLPESVYSAALEILFMEAGLEARREHLFDVMFRNVRVGSFRLDYLIEDRLVLELKAGHQLPPGSKAQLLTYMRASKRKLGLLLFYGPKPEIERVIL